MTISTSIPPATSCQTLPTRSCWSQCEGLTSPWPLEKRTRFSRTIALSARLCGTKASGTRFVCGQAKRTISFTGARCSGFMSNLSPVQARALLSHQHHHRPPLHPHLATRREGLLRLLDTVLRGVEDDHPPLAPVGAGGEAKGEGLVVAVEEDVEGIVHHPFAAGVEAGDGVAVQEHAEGLGEAALPVLLRHQLAVGAEPADVAHAFSTDGLAQEPAAAAEDRVLAPEGDEAGGEVDQVLVRRLPVEPGDLVVLAVGVVVPPLSAPHLVPPEQHGNALGEEEGGQKVALLAAPQVVDLRVAGGALDAAAPGAVVALAVAVVLAVGLVVLLVVGDEVAQGEAVVGGDEVDAGRGAPASGGLEFGAAGEAQGEVAQGPGLAPPVVADRVAVPAVPLGPERREVADLIAAFSHVPGLGDELDLADHRVLLDDVEEGRQAVHVVELAGQGGGEVEAEAVHVHVEHPVAQRVHDELSTWGWRMLRLLPVPV